MFDYSSRVAIVTGAAGNLGSVVARQLQSAGARTLLVDHASLEKMRERLGEPSEQQRLVAGADLTQGEQAKAIAAEAMDQFGRIDALFNIVGGFRCCPPVTETPDEDWRFLWEINLRTAANCCRAVVPLMQSAGYGRIVNIGARPALSGPGGLAPYSAAKSAVHRLTESLSEEVKQSGITVNAVLPSIIDTPQNREAMPDADTSQWVTPEQLSYALLFLGSEPASGITGALVPVFGKG